eukprot:3295171-Prymnesium_polylepis.1
MCDVGVLTGYEDVYGTQRLGTCTGYVPNTSPPRVLASIGRASWLPHGVVHSHLAVGNMRWPDLSAL